ncbi:MAG TPA: hypothetical protein ENK37_11140 [Oceanithermus profundus]|uniref:Uncharacterized protein n=1 Tax=Oceanithermus profundus TaxID=187137 RepID=A0A7C4VDV1_9DEIN|nr:hypothetical protein [Oceanithermus profundus]
MKIDDLIGLLFLLFFIVGPALRGLLKPREPLVEVELPPEDALPPELKEVLREVRAQPEPKPAPPPSAPAPPAQAPKPLAQGAQPRGASAPPAARGTKQTAEGHAAGARSRHRIEEARRDAADMAAEERAAFALDQPRLSERIGLSVSGKAIVRGMLWHEILSEPASKKRRRVRAPRRKLLS